MIPTYKTWDDLKKRIDEIAIIMDEAEEKRASHSNDPCFNLYSKCIGIVSIPLSLSFKEARERVVSFDMYYSAHFPNWDLLRMEKNGTIQERIIAQSFLLFGDGEDEDMNRRRCAFIEGTAYFKRIAVDALKDVHISYRLGSPNIG